MLHIPSGVSITRSCILQPCPVLVHVGILVPCSLSFQGLFKLTCHLLIAFVDEVLAWRVG